jgi:hypothetical protein
MTTKSGMVSILAILIGCGGSEGAPAKANVAQAPAFKAGTGIRIDAATDVISIDEQLVPAAGNCSAGQILERTATGWVCAAAAPDSAMLGGKTAASYLTTDGTAANATLLDGHAAASFLQANAQAADSARLEGHAAADFLGSHATAVNAALLNGHPDSDFLAAAGTAVNSALLNGHPATDFLAAAATAADSAKLGGQAASYYLPAAGTAANSAKLNGQPASYYLAATAIAADSWKLAGVPAANYARLDVPNTMRTPLSVRDPAVGYYGELYVGDIRGGDSLGNVHVYADSAGGDGHVYLNWFDGNGVIFGNGAKAKVAEIDGSGNLTASSYNGVQLAVRQIVLGSTCVALCANTSESCVAAQHAPFGTTSWAPAQCGDMFIIPSALKCVCAKF